MTVDLPILPPVAPMLCKPAAALPPEGGVLYEPKWDGFRCIAFRDGDEGPAPQREASHAASASPRGVAGGPEVMGHSSSAIARQGPVAWRRARTE